MTHDDENRIIGNSNLRTPEQQNGRTLVWLNYARVTRLFADDYGLEPSKNLILPCGSSAAAECREKKESIPKQCCILLHTCHICLINKDTTQISSMHSFLSTTSNTSLPIKQMSNHPETRLLHPLPHIYFQNNLTCILSLSYNLSTAKLTILHISMDAYDPLRDYNRQPSWSPITPTSPTAKLEFPEKKIFDVSAFIGNELAEQKSATTDVKTIDNLDASKEQISSRTKAGPAEPDDELQRMWKQVKDALRMELKDELKAEMKNELREELKEEVRRELRDGLLKQTEEAQSKSEVQTIQKMEDGVTTQQHVSRGLFDPFAPALLGPIKPGCEDGDVRAIAELDEAMKQVDEMMAKMDEEVERKFGEGKRG